MRTILLPFLGCLVIVAVSVALTAGFMLLGFRPTTAIYFAAITLTTGITLPGAVICLFAGRPQRLPPRPRWQDWCGCTTVPPGQEGVSHETLRRSSPQAGPDHD